MTMKRVLGAAVGGVMVAVAGVAVAANFTSSKQADFFAAGRHQFYVWCAGGSDFMAMQSGASGRRRADEALQRRKTRRKDQLLAGLAGPGFRLKFPPKGRSGGPLGRRFRFVASLTWPARAVSMRPSAFEMDMETH